MKRTLIAIVGILLSFSSYAEELSVNILAQDKSIVTAVKTEADNIWIKLSTGHLTAVITVKISNNNQDSYRMWFNGSTDLISSGYRGNGAWSDRVQSKAKYVEYWSEDKLILHLERK